MASMTVTSTISQPEQKQVSSLLTKAQDFTLDELGHISTLDQGLQ
jgi:hypothetical protein